MNRILIIQTASVGDVILATGILEKMHQHFPGAQISFLIKRGSESLFNGHPFLYHLYVWDKSRKYRDLIRLIREIRKERFDLVINLQRFFLTGCLTLLSGARETRGFIKNPLSRWFSRSFPHEIGNGKHEISRNQRMIEDLTDSYPARPVLYPPSGEDVMSAHNISKPFYTISPASLWMTKQYPAIRWAELIRNMPSGAMVVLLGSKQDRKLCEQILNLASSGEQAFPGQILNLAGELTLPGSASLMREARMNVTNESAPMHLASSTNAPVTVLYCSTVPAFGFGPLSDNSAIIETEEHLACRPCGLHGRRECPEKHFNCAMTIEIRKIMART